MAILSVDLAYKDYCDIGAVVLREAEGAIQGELLSLPLAGVPTPDRLAEWVDAVCTDRHIRIVLLDGPQGWRAADSDLVHSRQCERALNTPAKTGLPGIVKPAPYARFVTFSIAVFDALATRKWMRLARIGGVPAVRTTIESFPLAAWRSLGIPALPAKAKSTARDCAERVVQLQAAVPALQVPAYPVHDQLQAIVAGLAGIAIERGAWSACGVHGVAPVCEGGYWREGFIVTPTRDRSPRP